MKLLPSCLVVAMTLAGLAFTPHADALPIPTKMVSPAYGNGWQLFTNSTTGDIQFLETPANAPLGVGSLQFSTGADGDGNLQARTTNYAGLYLTNLTALAYSTYVTQFGSGGQAPYLILNLDTDGDVSTEEERIFFEPVYQNSVYFTNDQGELVTGMWQTWDAFNGGWWANNNTAGAGPGDQVKSLATILAAIPNARITSSSLGGLRFVAGGGAPDWNNVIASLDRFVIGTNSALIYDFEPNLAPLAEDQSFSIGETTSTIPVGTVIATDPNDGDVLTYTIEAGNDSGLFTLNSSSGVLSIAAINFETAPNLSFSLDVKVTDLGGLYTNITVGVTVTNINEAPTDIEFAGTSLPTEQQPIGTTIYTLSTVDEDLLKEENNESHTYTLVDGGGVCNDNEYFQIVGNQLQNRSNLVYSARSVYLVRVRSTDAGGLYTEESYYIPILPLFQFPGAAYSNDFSAGLTGWTNFPGLELQSDGSGHGLVAPGSPAAPTAAVTTFGGYGTGSAAGNGFQTSLMLYLDTNTAEGLKFGYAVVLNNPAGAAATEATFLVMRTNVSGEARFLINTAYGLPGSSENLDGSADAPSVAGSFLVSASGWYYFQHWFHQDASTNLVAELRVLSTDTNSFNLWTNTYALKVGVDVAGNRYGKIFGNEFTSLLVDDSRLTVIPRPTALGTSMLVEEDFEALVLLLGQESIHFIPTLRYKITTAPLHGMLDVPTNVYIAFEGAIYTPDANYNGSDSFKFVVNYGAQDSLPATVNITVHSINDAPSFSLSTTSTTVAEDSASTTLPIVNSASVNKGAPNESGQIISYSVDNGYNTGLFMTQPTVSGIGYLTFRPAANASGSTTIYVRATDNGGTVCYGQDTSSASAFTINITPSNDVPVMVALTNVTVNEGLTSTPTVNVPIPVTDLETAANNLILSVVLSNQTGGIVIPASVSTSYSGGWTVNLPVVSETSGQVNVHVTATDTGEGASPARSVSRTFLFKVNPVNDAPGFLMASNTVSANQNVAASVSGFAAFRQNANLFPDPTEASQTGTYVVTVPLADKAKFSLQPTISAAGVLSFKFATTATGSVVTTVKVTDTGGTANGGVNVSSNQTLTFNVNP